MTFDPNDAHYLELFLLLKMAKVTLAIAVLWISIGAQLALCEEKGSEKPSEKPPNVKIKIVEAPASRITPFQPGGAKELKLRIKQANLSGPAHLLQLAGECFTLKEKGYEYCVCPFHNVTQKEERIGWNSFHGVLGVWREWLIEEDTFVGMHYVMGQECSVGDREVKVLFNCSTITRLHNTSEPSTCHYIIWLDTPLACFKGAMQVYHLLTADQVKRWEQFEYEYYADELTLQGLTKRRRKLLTEAGLLFDYEKERVRLAEEKRQREEEEKRQREQREKETAANPLFKTQLKLCEEERDQLRRELDELTAKIRAVVKDYPAVAYRLGFLQNSTHTKFKPDGTDAPSTDTPQEKKEGEEGEVVVVDSHPAGVEELAAAAVDGGEWDSDPAAAVDGGEREREDSDPAAAVDGGEREREDEKEWSRGGFIDHDQSEHMQEGQPENILNEINEEVEERDMKQLKRELAELQRPEIEEEEGERDVVSDEQLLELIEEMKQAQQVDDAPA